CGGGRARLGRARSGSVPGLAEAGTRGAPPASSCRRHGSRRGATEVEGDRQIREQAHGDEVRTGGMVMTTNVDGEVRLADAPPIPGLLFRMFDPVRDYEGLVALIREAHLRDGIDWIPTVEILRTEHEHGGEFDPRRDMLLALVDGTIVGASQTDVRTRALGPNHQVEGWVSPAFRRRGLGRALLHWAEARAREVALVDGRTGERSLSSWPDEDQAGAVALYEGEGYVIVRYGFMMLRDLSDPIPERRLPDGLEVRPVAEADHR